LPNLDLPSVWGFVLRDRSIIAVADNELSLSMWRPVAENVEVEVQFYEHEKCWLRGQVMKIKSRLDGNQTVNPLYYERRWNALGSLSLAPRIQIPSNTDINQGDGPSNFTYSLAVAAWEALPSTR
jgi:hypothetical protein